MDETPPPSPAGPGNAAEVFQAFLIQGLTALGGLVAHIRLHNAPASPASGKRHAEPKLDVHV